MEEKLKGIEYNKKLKLNSARDIDEKTIRQGEGRKKVNV
jgi:hypothetical protein